MINSLKKNKAVYENIQYEFCKVKNIKNTIVRLEKKYILDEIELFEIKNFAININKIMKYYSKLNLNVDYINFKSLGKVVQLLDPENLKLTTFRIYEAYSKQLLLIRQKKLNVEKEIFSSTDIENIEKLKKKRLEIVIQEDKEVLKIRKALTEELYNYLIDVKENTTNIGKLDLLIAKADLAIKYNAIKPSINEENKIYFKELVNPNLQRILDSQGKQYIPISIELDKKITIISGANMGGKSVSMKTIALNLYLFQCGFFIFAKEANLCILDFIYLVSDDMQDINKGLSTFGAEIIKLKEITKLIKIRDGFIALDEFSRGTNPIEGRLLLRSICEYFKQYNSISLISTHLDDINISDVDYYQVIGLKNVNFEGLKRQIDLQIGTDKSSNGVKILQEYMDYRMEKVSKETKVPKDAINICKLLGLDNEIINIANKLSE
ncbi:MAG: MutS-related protein [Paraclostridium sp.]|uniref:lysine 5,6-aminomutase reactivase ATPase KamC n=1 Tax=Paraclostridium sp. TaxID=2023273 RepID=UPI003EE748E4